ncbi:MAG: four-carbon acid sugar kinase family protein [Paracoccaceae bacterium]
MLIGAIGDDFTGSGDLANMLARAGLSVQLRTAIPTEPLAPTDRPEAVVIALKTRTVPAAEAVAQSRAAVAWLRAQGAPRILFKYCSTFDSTPEGNIGPVAEALAQDLSADKVLCEPSFPETGRTVYLGHMFVGDRLLSEGPLAHHPLTPMTDPDLRRWLQTRTSVGHLPLTALRGADPEGFLSGQCGQFIIADAIDDDDIDRLGRLAVDAPLVTGGSAIGAGLARALVGTGRKAATTWQGVAGPAVVLAGSCSAATLGQIAAYVGHAQRQVAVEDILADPALPQKLADWALTAGEAPMISVSQPPEAVLRVQETHGRERTAAAIDAMFAALARALVDRGVTRLVVAGGETSGAVTLGLGLDRLDVGPQIAPGVPALAAGGLRLALKSGNFGGADFFTRAVALLGGETSA